MAGMGGMAPVVGVDLGGTKILAGVVDAENKILGRAKRSTPAEAGGLAILAAITSCIDQALAEANVHRDQIIGIGVGSPGPLDPATGVIAFSANLNVKNWPLGPDLTSAMGKPVLVQNDVRVGGYGEYHLGAGRGHRSLLAAFVGTGIGGCLILDDKIFEGATGNAGEVGHIVVKADGPKCGCGRRGCLEALSSRSAIARRVTKAARNGEESMLASKVDKKSGKLKSGDIAAAFAAGDHVAIREIHRAAYFLGLGLGGLVNLIGPEIVVIGGGVTEALGPMFLNLVRDSAREQILVDPEDQIKIELAELGDDAGILGAALLARERFADS
ncbi:ROK family protein [Tundrisphaera lichenicola]|uniref:ROK family protein n=1 Tax=Tundrisphaera lichenicola TaxID=2029860 RepID=UPI003EC0DE7E